MPTSARALAACLAATTLSLAGCSDPYAGRMDVSGAVKLKGQPIPDGGLVVLEPLDGQDTGVNAEIKGGAYSVSRQNGLKPGKYLVRVSVPDAKTPINPLNPDEPPGPGGSGSRGTNFMAKDLVPPEWNVNSKHQVTVTKEGPNTFDFDIP